MPRPHVLQKLDQCITVSDEQELNETLPTNADTLEGHPASYFASKTEVNTALSNYITTILGKSY